MYAAAYSVITEVDVVVIRTVREIVLRSIFPKLNHHSSHVHEVLTLL
jgi:hypothetical protein